MESAGDPEEQPFIAAAPAPPGGPRSRAIRVGCGTAAAALVLALMAVVANSTQARGMKVVSGKGESVLSAEGHVADAGLGAEPMQNAVGLDINVGGDNNGVVVGGDNKGKIVLQKLDGKCQNLPDFAMVVEDRDVGALMDYRDCVSAEDLMRLFTSNHTKSFISTLPQCNLAQAAFDGTAWPEKRAFFKTMMDLVEQSPARFEYEFCESCQAYCCWARVENIVSYWPGNPGSAGSHYNPAHPINSGFARCQQFAGPPADAWCKNPKLGNTPYGERDSYGYLPTYRLFGACPDYD